jgi:hypothetical protein
MQHSCDKNLCYDVTTYPFLRGRLYSTYIPTTSPQSYTPLPISEAERTTLQHIHRWNMMIADRAYTSFDSTAGKPITGGPPATACSKGTAETPTTPLDAPGTSAVAERPATGNHQELKGRQQQQECLPQSECKQQQ